MNLIEVVDDIFNSHTDYYLAQCVSADCAMGITNSGIEIKCLALSMRKRFPDMPDYCSKLLPKVGDVLLYSGDRNVYNLVTKELYYLKPTYSTVRSALENLRKCIVADNVHNLAIPRLGSDMDKLNWVTVKSIISEVFFDIDVDIVVYRLR
jgi:hypothetical protein